MSQAIRPGNGIGWRKRAQAGTRARDDSRDFDLDLRPGIKIRTDGRPVAEWNPPAVYQNRNWSTRVQGVSPAFFEIRLWPPAVGNSSVSTSVAPGARLTGMPLSIWLLA